MDGGRRSWVTDDSGRWRNDTDGIFPGRAVQTPWHRHCRRATTGRARQFREGGCLSSPLHACLTWRTRCARTARRRRCSHPRSSAGSSVRSCAMPRARVSIATYRPEPKGAPRRDGKPPARLDAQPDMAVDPLGGTVFIVRTRRVHAQQRPQLILSDRFKQPHTIHAMPGGGDR